MANSTMCNSVVDASVIQNSQLINVTGAIIDSNHDGLGLESTIVGRIATGSGDFSTGVGYRSNIGGDNSVAVGHLATAANNRTVAVGAAALCAADDTVALGPLASVSATLSLALTTTDTEVNGTNCVIVGQTTTVASAATGATVLGRVSTYTTDSIMVGNHSAAHTATGLILIGDSCSTGQNSLCIGRNSSGIGVNTDQVVVGNNNTAKNQWAVAVGYGNNADGIRSVVIGKDCQAVDEGVAIGYTAIADGVGDIAIGNFTTGNGIAIGDGATCNGNSSLVIGIDATSANTANGEQTVYGREAAGNGDRAIVIGFEAAGNDSHCVAIGQRIVCGGDTAVAIGPDVTTSGTNAVAIGNSTVATGGGVALGPLCTAGTTNAAIGTSMNNSVANSILMGIGGAEYLRLGPIVTANQAGTLFSAVVCNGLHGLITMAANLPASHSGNFTVQNTHTTTTTGVFCQVETDRGVTATVVQRNAGTFIVRIVDNEGAGTGVIPKLRFFLFSNTV